MKPYIFFLDIDGTLAHAGKVPEENVCAIKEARQKGHFVFINTGRSYAHIPEEILSAAPYDGFVCGLGTDIRFREERIFSKALSLSVLEKATEIFLAIPDAFVIFEGEDKLYLIGGESLPESGEEITSPKDFPEKYPDAKISKITRSNLKEEPLSTLCDVLEPYIHPTYAEYGQKDCDKARGMHFVAEKLGVPNERCVAIGDSANDKEMLEAAGIAVVMGNHTPGMEQYADFITDTAQRAGVAKAIRKLINE